MGQISVGAIFSSSDDSEEALLALTGSCTRVRARARTALPQTRDVILS